MDRQGDDLVTRLTKLFAFLLVLILSFHQVTVAEAAEPFSKDELSIPSLDENTAIYAGTWVADSEKQAFLLLGNEKEMWLAVAAQLEDGTYQLIAQSKAVLSYEAYCLGSVEMMDLWYSGHPYFWYYVGQEIKLYLLASDAGDGTWIVHGGYIDAYGGYIDACEEDIHFNFYASSREDSTAYRENPTAYREASEPYGDDHILVYETCLPQIEWPIGDNLKLEDFDITIIQRECEDALNILIRLRKRIGWAIRIPLIKYFGIGNCQPDRGWLFCNSPLRYSYPSSGSTPSSTRSFPSITWTVKDSSGFPAVSRQR